ncbi:phosphate ABC transporter permease subunit PstC [Myxacorys almedinensis]|uniref:Phosphate transport system permease protein n=1 Tax=Myxacorys almedinensis A TaxID=2690445 RepID=A0A8J8CKC6_9CYAN|nr:phosphate ABC transporter permease subunit PstC [Myxacorys almedinensis]NDJ16505.1 phosphate ABC transporter permease subunit PstC [Myxacorys almedinensis A]
MIHQMSSNAHSESIVGGDRAWLDRSFAWVLRLIALAAIALLFWMGNVILQSALPAIAKFGATFLTSQDWDVNQLQFGALPYLYGTAVTSAIALLFAVPIGISVAIVTSEPFLPTWVRSPLGFLIELIASIPSVIVGLWGIFVLIPFLKPIQLWLHDQFGWIPLFSTETFGPSMLVAGIILAIMILPTIAALSRDIMTSVPSDLRTASMALGATRWEMIFTILLPASASGIVGAVILGLGRALGETMAVTMVIGNSDLISVSLLDSGNTIPALLANQFPEALDELHVGALMYLALILFALTLIVNILAMIIVKIFGFKY